MSRTLRNAGHVAWVVAVLALGVGVSAAQPRLAGAGGITVSADVNFEGATMTVRGDVPDLRNIQLNDRISSLQVSPGESWEVCENVNYGGRCMVVSGVERDLRARGMNDTISSMRRVEGRDDRRGGDDRDARGGLGMTVFDDVNFEGAALTIRRDVPDLRALQFNDRISSVQVPPGESWEVCEHTNYDGRCFVVSGVERDLRRRGLNDVISSTRRVQGREDRGDRDDSNNRRGVIVEAQPARGEIVLFDGPGYRGAAQRVTAAAAGLGSFANRAQSAQILEGVWELCDEPRWSGRCVRISGSVPDLGRIGLRSVASARPLDQPR